jgi:hypothetical protein
LPTASPSISFTPTAPPSLLPTAPPSLPPTASLSSAPSSSGKNTCKLENTHVICIIIFC